jgi:FtsZ-interacting cell division protein ZipA
MSSEQIIWVLVAIVVVAALVGVAMMASRRRGTAKVEHRRHEAEQLREDAVAGASGLTSSRAEAQEARAEAEAAQNRAAQAQQGAAMDEAVVEDRVREADRIDPDVDHQADDYRPETPTARGDAATSDGLGRRDQAADQTTSPTTATSSSSTDPSTDPTTDPTTDPKADSTSEGTHRA